LLIAVQSPARHHDPWLIAFVASSDDVVVLPNMDRQQGPHQRNQCTYCVLVGSVSCARIVCEIIHQTVSANRASTSARIMSEKMETREIRTAADASVTGIHDMPCSWSFWSSTKFFSQTIEHFQLPNFQKQETCHTQELQSSLFYKTIQYLTKIPIKAGSPQFHSFMQPNSTSSIVLHPVTLFT
jgi:hypothetical protein